MLKTRRLLHGQEITYPEVVDLEAVNVLQQLNYYHRHKQFFGHLNNPLLSYIYLRKKKTGKGLV